MHPHKAQNQNKQKKSKLELTNTTTTTTTKKMLRTLPSHTTSTTILAFRLTTLLFLFSCLCNQATSLVRHAHIFIYAGCSAEKYQPNSPFEANLKSFLSSAYTSSSQDSYNSFAVGNGTSGSPEDSVFGLYQCRGDLKSTDCAKCVESAVSQIGLVCPYSLGGSLQLEGCLVRYEHFDFLGKPDTSVRYKKCSKGVSNDVEFFRRRDDVLADLLQTVLGFKVSNSGLVEGFAQCLGDLSPSDCSSCLAEAVSKLKSLCGSAAAADVFLAQCYARYWASGYYDFSDSSHEDQVGRNVAIIVGIIAGLAIFIVLLSFCRKAMG